MSLIVKNDILDIAKNVIHLIVSMQERMSVLAAFFLYQASLTSTNNVSLRMSYGQKAERI